MSLVLAQQFLPSPTARMPGRTCPSSFPGNGRSDAPKKAEKVEAKLLASGASSDTVELEHDTCINRECQKHCAIFRGVFDSHDDFRCPAPPPERYWYPEAASKASAPGRSEHAESRYFGRRCVANLFQHRLKPIGSIYLHDLTESRRCLLIQACSMQPCLTSTEAARKAGFLLRI